MIERIPAAWDPREDKEGLATHRPCGGWVYLSEAVSPVGLPPVTLTAYCDRCGQTWVTDVRWRAGR